MKKERNEKLKIELIRLIKECRENFSQYVSKGRLNSEGKKIQLQIIKAFIQYTNDKRILSYVSKDDELEFIKMINFLEKILENPPYL